MSMCRTKQIENWGGGTFYLIGLKIFWGVIQCNCLKRACNSKMGVQRNGLNLLDAVVVAEDLYGIPLTS